MCSYDYQVQLINFPGKGKEAVTENEDGSYTIFINSRLSRDMQLLAYYHALRHIAGTDFEKYNADEIEYSAHL